jgi:SagB-type dehydrogenase family enzyme
MSEKEPLTSDEIGRALDAAKARIEEERRAQFLPFGIPVDCLWPSSRLFHEHSSLGPCWRPVLTLAEVETITKNLDYKRYTGAERTALPHPAHLSANLESTIRSRRSRSEFSDRPVSLAELSKLLELGSGVTSIGEIPRRAAPSGGALYPVETYALAFEVDGIRPGLYHYYCLDHSLEHVRPLSGIEVTKPFLPPRLSEGRPKLMLALSVVFARTQMKYLERGYRFALLEAGHVAQNIVLAATALGLSSVCAGGFWDEPFNDLLGLEPAEEAVVYSILLGHAAGHAESSVVSTRE